MEKLAAEYPTLDDGEVSYGFSLHNQAPEGVRDFLLTNASDSVRE